MWAFTAYIQDTGRRCQTHNDASAYTRPRLLKAANYSKENHIHNTFKQPEADEMGTGEAEARFPNLMHRQLHVCKTLNDSEPHD